jgi:nicotinate dehydrogenase subunit B
MKFPQTDRRTFLKTTGHLLIGFNLFPFIQCTSFEDSRSDLPEYIAIPERPHLGRELIDSWIRLDAKGHVTVLTGKKELGQGIRTALLQIAADELEVEIERCHIINGDTGQTSNEGYTSGSNSIEGSGLAIRRAAAETKYFLMQMAAENWKVDLSEVSAKDGIIFGPGKMSISYWELVNGKYYEKTFSDTAPILDFNKHKYVGKPVPREDIKNLVLGKSHFVHDLRFQGMVHARILHPPSYKAKLKHLDQSAVASMDGVIKVIVDGSFVAVIAKREYQAIRALQKLKKLSVWEESKINILPESLFQNIKLNAQKAQIIEDSPGITEKINASTAKFKASYYKPYHMHASAGPSCAVATWENGQLTVWSPTQGVYPLQDTLSDLFTLDKHKIRCIGIPGSGCYGHNGADDVSAEVALIAKHLPGKHVRLQWMREDEHLWEPFGSTMIIELEAGVDEKGKIQAWDTHIWSDSHSTRPRGEAGYFISARHLGNPFTFNKGGYSGGAYRNATPLYSITSKRLQLYNYDGPLRSSALRGLGAYANIFALESFMDELAHLAGMDPLEFRIKNLDDWRAKAVLENLAEKTNWSSLDRSGNKGYGIAFAKYKNSAAYFAVMAEIEKHPEKEAFKLARMVGVIEAGQCINPDGIINQTEGGMIQSASWTLMEEVKYGANGVLSKDWNTYPILRSREIPKIEVHLINRPELPPLGAGEAAQGPVAAAIANAFFDATGNRVRNLPLKTEKKF